MARSKNKGRKHGASRSPGPADRKDADRDALRDAFAGVAPLRNRGKRRVIPPGEPNLAPRGRRSDGKTQVAPLQVMRETDGTVVGRREGTHRSILASLEDPRLEIEAECDLHRMTAAEADREVLRFVRTQQSEGARWVLIIVGKGLHSPGGRGRLREHIVDTLSQRAASRFVLAFRTAPRTHGGSGALAIRLRDRLDP